MHQLTSPTDVSTSSSGFETIKDGKVWIHVASTFGTGYVTMEKSIDRGENWTSFYPDGVEEKYTAATTGEVTKLFDLPGGWFFRFTNDDTAGAAGTLTTCYVDGPHIRVDVTAGT